MAAKAARPERRRSGWWPPPDADGDRGHGAPLSVLLVDDDDDVGDLVRHRLATHRAPANVDQVSTLRDATDALIRADYDAILVNLLLADGTGAACVSTMGRSVEGVPIVALTGSDDDELALACFRAGAQDFVAKRDIGSRDLSRIVRYAVARAREALRRHRLSERQGTLTTVWDVAVDAVASVDADGIVLDWSAAAAAMFNQSAGRVIGRRFDEVVRPATSVAAAEQADILSRALRGEPVWARDVVRSDTGGRRIPLSLTAFGLLDDKSRIARIWLIMRAREVLGGDGDKRPPHDILSVREMDVLRGVASGRAIKELAGDLAISEKTVATYIARIRRKTGLSNAVEMTRYAIRHRIAE